MTDGVIVFRSFQRQRDAAGVYRDQTPVDREVFARVESVSREEFFSGGQSGFRPEYRFKVFHGEYHGENECKYEGRLYSIYRTFRPEDSDDIELYVKRKAGVHSAPSAGESQSQNQQEAGDQSGAQDGD